MQGAQQQAAPASQPVQQIAPQAAPQFIPPRPAPTPDTPEYYKAELSPDQIYARNSAYAQASPKGYITNLSPADETKFQGWVKQNKVPFDPSPKADYDMRGFWLGMKNGDPSVKTAVNPNDNQLHFVDKFKTPYHMSFSNESQWAQPGAPSWNEKDQLITPDGKVVFDERALAQSRGARD